MLDKHGVVCEYDGYVLPPAPKVVTPEMRQRKKELMIEIEQFFAKVNAEIDAEENDLKTKDTECVDGQED